MIDDLRTLVEVESPSLDLEALGESAAVLAALIEARLGRNTELVEPGGAARALERRRRSEGAAARASRHGVPLGTLAQRPFRVDDGVATGPGVFDMLGGIVQALHGLTTVEPDVLAGVELLFSADEEVGSLASRELIEARASACGAVLVLEPSADGGALKTGRKGCGTFEVLIGGRAAHAGLEPEKGINVLVEAAYQVLDIAALARPELGTTVTPSVAAAGTADNVVPAGARCASTCASSRRRRRSGSRPRWGGDSPPTSTARPSRCAARSTGRRCPSLRPPSCSRWPVSSGADGGGARCRRRQRRQLHRSDRRADARRARGRRRGAHADHEWIDVDAMPGRAMLIAGIVERILAN